MLENMQLKNIIRWALILLVFLGIVLGARRLALGDAQLVKLSAAPALSGQISQALGPNPNGSLLTEGKDYIFAPHYFNESDWAVANIKPTNNDSKAQNGYVVMKKSGGIFQVVFGPGTAIASTQLSSLPPDVAGYLNTRVAVYTPVVGQ